MEYLFRPWLRFTMLCVMMGEHRLERLHHSHDCPEAQVDGLTARWSLQTSAGLLIRVIQSLIPISYDSSPNFSKVHDRPGLGKILSLV